ncbi:MAG: RAD55 family ATPase [Thaumarchaeota archaeon]|nr:RAD55 family ATPase [Nitrososphaerota archaeon]
MTQVASTIRRVPSGIEGLDKLISGGIPEGTTTMVYGPPKAGKSVFAYHFLNGCIQSNGACLFVMTD